MLSNSATAVVFPGQGSQVAGMRDLVAATRPDLLEAVLDLVGDDPFERLEDSTRYAQPAIFCASLAGWTRLQGHVDPVALAGHSLGELTALAAGGALDELAALELVVLRGRLMAVSGEQSGGGTMLALLGGTPAQAAQLAARHRVSLANDNAPGQVVLSGTPDALAEVQEAARADGLRAMMLDVAGAFHSPQMEAARAPFAAALAQVEFRPTPVTVFSCASAKPFADPATELADALVRPVQWRRTMEALVEAGAQAVVDAGPGQVLAKLARRCTPSIGAASAATLLESADVA
ncbi:MAG: Acyl transferase [Solirubrobacterales bacterium]|nr:Acyl transferase [Solirubrobacterales bacterium]